MHSGLKTALLAIATVVVAAALIFAGFLLGMDPGVRNAVRDFFGWDYGSEVDSDLQQEILEKLESTYYREIDPETIAVGAVDGMLAGLNDPYTFYMDPEEYAAFKENTLGEYSGVGVIVQMSDRLVTVVSVYKGAPAEAAGVREGDIVLTVDGVSTSGRTLAEVAAGIKGPEGTTVVLEIYRPAVTGTTSTTAVSGTEDGAGAGPEEEGTPPTGASTVDLSELPQGGVTKEYTLTRRALDISVPATERLTLDASGKEVALIALYSFSEDCADELRADVRRAVEEDHVDAIILDLRSNPGGLVDEAVGVASIFIESGVIVSTSGLHSAEEVRSAAGHAYEDVPLYVLTDENSASASEIVVGALQDYGRATLVGETTFGKSQVVSINPLSNGGALNVTIAVYLTPKGRDIGVKGISPDIVAPDDPETPTVDETVEKVLDLISAESAGP